MSSSKITEAVETELKRRGKSIRFKAAIEALPSLLPCGIGEIYSAAQTGITEERQRLQLDLLCELVEKIDAALGEMATKGADAGVIEIDGVIRVKAEGVKRATGVEIVNSPSGVLFKPGTFVDVDARNTDDAAAVRIGRRKE